MAAFLCSPRGKIGQLETRCKDTVSPAGLRAGMQDRKAVALQDGGHKQLDCLCGRLSEAVEAQAQSGLLAIRSGLVDDAGFGGFVERGNCRAQSV